MGEQWWGLGPMTIPSELGHLAVPIIFPCLREKLLAQASFEHGTCRSRVLRCAVAPHWLCNLQAGIEVRRIAGDSDGNYHYPSYGDPIHTVQLMVQFWNHQKISISINHQCPSWIVKLFIMIEFSTYIWKCHGRIFVNWVFIDKNLCIGPNYRKSILNMSPNSDNR